MFRLRRRHLCRSCRHHHRYCFRRRYPSDGDIADVIDSDYGDAIDDEGEAVNDSGAC